MSYFKDLLFALALAAILFGIEFALGLTSWWWILPNSVILCVVSEKLFPENRN